MVGVNSRAALLNSLGTSLAAYPEVFGPAGRPGNLVGKEESPLQTAMRLTVFRFYVK